MSDEQLELTTEDIKKISETLATCVEYMVVNKEEVKLDLVASAMAGVTDPLGQLQDWLTSMFDSVSSWIVSTVETWIEENVIPVIDGITSWITDNVIPVISDVVTGITDWLSENVVPAISDAVTSISDWISENVIPAISDAVTSISDWIKDNVIPAIDNAVTSISNAISDVTTSISSYISDNVLPAISGVVTSISSYISDNVLPAITNVVTSLSEWMSTNIIPVINSVITSVSDFITNNVLPAITNLGTTVQTGLSSILNLVTESFENMVSMVSAGFQSISTAFMGFTNAIMILPELLASRFEWIKQPVAAVGNFFIVVYNYVQNIVADPTAALQSFIDWFWKGLKWLGGVIWDAMLFLADLFVKGVKGLWSVFEKLGKFSIGVLSDFGLWVIKNVSAAVINAIPSIAKVVVPPMKNAIEKLFEYSSDIYEEFGKLLTQPIVKLLEPFGEKVAEKLEEPFTKLIESLASGEEGRGQWHYLLGFGSLYFGHIILAQFGFRGLWAFFNSLATSFDRVMFHTVIHYKVKAKARGRGKASPLGVGAEGGAGASGSHEVEVWRRIPVTTGAIFRHIAKEMKQYADELGRALIYGYSIWISQPMFRMASAAFRNWLVIELPPMDMITEALRRYMPTKEFDKTYEAALRHLRLYGFSDRVIDWLISKETPLKITDRFGQPRNIPLSLMYRLPSASDVATMMVRDIFASPEDFFKLYKATGMVEDIGALYYFLRYKYPPPERLWKFTLRGVSGLLWATLTDNEIREIMETEAKPLGAAKPISPVKLNFDAETLFNAFKTYMKWHDYARFSWFKEDVHGFNFTSDNMIVVDTLADVPTKIDQRWMVKWGIYELLSEKRVTRKSPIQHFVKKVLENAAVSQEIKMDLTNFCRTLQATGLHPYWIPVTAVAEAMNALTEERTLLRTGFINLFKEGFWGIEALEKLLAGFIKTSFKVSYFDIERMEWKDGWINIPVMFLPPERRLLELRALMDRTLDVLRDIARDVTKGYQEWIIADYNEYKSKLTGVIEKINEVFASDYKAITGVELPDNLKLTYVEEYYKPYIESLSIWRDIYTVRRVRSWTSRFIGWVMYRLAYGSVEKSDVENLITYVSEKAKLTGYEVEFLKGVMNILYGVAQREYAPTPSQLATLSEYVVIPQDVILKSLTARKIPQEWIDIWKQYISVRPIANDVRGLLTSYRRALLYVKVPDDIANKVVKYAKLIGFTDREFDILNLRVTLEELILQARENLREYIPTPLSLASICEYLPEARKFFNDVMKAKRVPKEWQSLWAKYVDIRPLVDEIKKYLSRAESLYVYFMIKKEDFKKVLDEIKETLGYTSKEIEFIMKITDFERYRVAWRELIGTVDRLVSLSEYSPTASEYALGKLKEMIDALPLPDNEKNKLKEMWKQYIKNKPVKSEAKMYVTQLINLFVDGLITDNDLERELEAMKEWGFSDNEIMFYKAIAALRKARKLRIPLVYGE